MRTEPQETLGYFLQQVCFLLRAQGAIIYYLSPGRFLYPGKYFFLNDRHLEIPNLEIDETWLEPDLKSETAALAPDQVKQKLIAGFGPALIAPSYSYLRDIQSGKIIDQKLEGVLVAVGKREKEAFDLEDQLILARLSNQLASIIVTSRMTDYELVLERFPVGILSIDSQTGRIILGNARAGEVIGQDEILGRDFEQILPPELKELIQRAQETGQADGEITSSTTGTFFRVEAISQSAINDRQSTQVVVAFVDATYIHQTEAIVAQMSHDLRLPLTAIQGYTQTLLQGIDQEREVDSFEIPFRLEFYQTIINQAHLLFQMIDQMLSIARLRAGKALELEKTEFDLVGLIKEMMVVYADRFTSAHQAILELPEKLLVVADRTKIQQVFLNLITNAVKYSPDGGKVRIKAVDLGKEALVAIKDQGIGIAPQDIVKIGDWCFRTDSSRTLQGISGIGIGMFFVRNLIKAHQGQLTIESEGLGKGATFTFTIPKELT